MENLPCEQNARLLAFKEKVMQLDINERLMLLNTVNLLLCAQDNETTARDEAVP